MTNDNIEPEHDEAEGPRFNFAMTIGEILNLPPQPPQILTSEQLDMLEKLDHRATPEPWKPCMDVGGGRLGCEPKDGIQYGGECDFGGFGIKFNGSFDPAADVRLIAATRNFLPGLVWMARGYLSLKENRNAPD